MKRLFLIAMTTLLAQTAFAGNCEFSALISRLENTDEPATIFDIEKDAAYKVTKEKTVKIPRDVFFANKAYFDSVNLSGNADCRGALVGATITNKKTGAKFSYYRTNEDRCDGGNTYGLIVGGPRGKKAVAYINDSFLECAK